MLDEEELGINSFTPRYFSSLGLTERWTRRGGKRRTDYLARRLKEQCEQNTHRSHSPKTTSMALSTAVVSASMWPFIMKSIACKCEKAVGRILQR